MRRCFLLTKQPPLPSSSTMAPLHHNPCTSPSPSSLLLPYLRLLTTIAPPSTSVATHNQGLAIQSRLKELGVDQRTLSLFELFSRPTQWDTVQLLLDQGFTAQQIRPMLQKHVFLLPCRKLVAFLDFLRTLNVTGEDACNIISKYPFYLLRGIGVLERKVAILESFGLERERIKRTLVIAPRIFSISPETFRRRVSWLQDMGMNNTGIRLMLERNPMVMSVSMASLRGKMDVLRQLGFDKDLRRFLALFVVAATYSKERIVARFNTLMAHGLSSDQVRHILHSYPAALEASEETISKKIHYLTKELNRDVEEIAKCPSFLCCSLERRIIPRFKLLADAKEKGLIAREFSLSTVITITDTDFHLWVMKIQKESRNENSEADSKSCNVS